MPGNTLKTPIAYSLNAIAQQRAAHIASLIGKGLPCQVVEVLLGPIVRVSFDVISTFNIPILTMPVATSAYVRPPIQIGDYGRATPTGAQVATIAGLGTGTAGLGLEGNLSTLVFEPLTSSTWDEIDTNACVITGPNGVVLRDSANKCVWTQTPSGVTLVLPSGGTLAITGNITATGEITRGYGGSDQVTLGQHEHPTAATGSPSPPTPGT